MSYIEATINDGVKILLSVREAEIENKTIYKIIGINSKADSFVVESEDKDIAMKILGERMRENDNPTNLSDKIKEGEEVIKTVEDQRSEYNTSVLSKVDFEKKGKSESEKKNFDESANQIISRRNAEFDRTIKAVNIVIDTWKDLEGKCKKLK